MIKYNNSNINDWYFDESDIIKVYRNNAVVYYKLITSGGTPEYKVCYAVVDDISQYQETEFEDVYNKADSKWYKLNNLNQYEEYGVYGDSIATSGSSRLPQGYTEVEYVQNNTQGAYINTGLLLYDATGNSFSISAKLKSQYESTWAGDGYYLQTIINSEDVSRPYYGFTYRYAYQTHNLECSSSPSNSVSFSSTANTDGTSSLTISCNSTTVTSQVPLELFASYQSNYNTPYRFSNATIYSFQVTKNNTLVRDLVPCKRDSDSMVGLYDLVNDVFYYPPNYSSYQLVAGSAVTPTAATYYEGKLAIVDGYEYQYSGNSWVNVGEVSGGQTEYPIYYDEKSDPLNNLTFSSMTEATEYAYYNCVYDGLKATIAGDKYIFSGNSQSGYEWVEQTLPYDAEIEYLESSGTQYINTNKYLNTSNFEIGYNILGNWIKWGYTHQGSGAGTWITVESSTAFFGKYNNGRVSITTSNVENVIKYVSTSGITVNDTYYSKTFAIGTDSIASIPLYLFARYDFRNGIDYDSSGKVKSFYLKNNDELVLDMIPVRVGQVGYMYDRVSSQLFGNDGTGDFILGTDKN